MMVLFTQKIVGKNRINMVYVPKTQINDENVLNFLESIEDNIKKQDCLEILDMMIKIS